MPVLTGAGCIANLACPIPPFPSAGTTCTPELSVGGVNTVYILPCTESFTETDILDLTYYTALIAAGSVGSLGKGLGSISKKATKNERISSCLPEQLISTTWALKFIMKAFDKTSADTTTNQINALINRSSSYLALARMCDGDDTILPIGKFSISDFDWTVPDNYEEVQSIMVELSWKELGKPKTYTVAGLSSVLPKS